MNLCARERAKQIMPSYVSLLRKKPQESTVTEQILKFESGQLKDDPAFSCGLSSISAGGDAHHRYIRLGESVSPCAGGTGIVVLDSYFQWNEKTLVLTPVDELQVGIH